MVRRPNKLIYVEFTLRTKKNDIRELELLRGASDVPRHCGDSKDTEGRSCEGFVKVQCGFSLG